MRAIRAADPSEFTATWRGSTLPDPPWILWAAWDTGVLTVKRAVRRLSLDDQGLLPMRFAAGLDSNQIGAQSGMSASGVRSRLAGLLDRLRTDLDDG